MRRRSFLSAVTALSAGTFTAASTTLTAPAALGSHQLVGPCTNGKLVYTPFANNGETAEDNVIPDFSHAGYRAGQALPSRSSIPVRETLSRPTAGMTLPHWRWTGSRSNSPMRRIPRSRPPASGPVQDRVHGEDHDRRGSAARRGPGRHGRDHPGGDRDEPVRCAGRRHRSCGIVLDRSADRRGRGRRRGDHQQLRRQRPTELHGGLDLRVHGG